MTKAYETPIKLTGANTKLCPRVPLWNPVDLPQSLFVVYKQSSSVSRHRLIFSWTGFWSCSREDLQSERRQSSSSLQRTRVAITFLSFQARVIKSGANSRNLRPIADGRSDIRRMPIRRPHFAANLALTQCLILFRRL